jgi:DNA-binding MarR family transcriptional regulator
MVSTELGSRVDELGQAIVDLVTQFYLTTPRGRRNGQLKEVEFLTLSVLNHHETLIVGDIQRYLGVLPAQMSRIIRSLETREPSLIRCQINSHDKRKINVSLTPHGLTAFQEYQAARTGNINHLLSKLPAEDLEDMDRLVSKMHYLLRPGHPLPDLQDGTFAHL